MPDYLVEPEVKLPPPSPDTSVSVLQRIESLLKIQNAPRKLYHGKITALSTPHKLSFPSVLFFKSITFYSDTGNSDEIYIGNHDVSPDNCPPLNPNADVTLENIYGNDISIHFTTLNDILWWEGEV